MVTEIIQSNLKSVSLECSQPQVCVGSKLCGNTDCSDGCCESPLGSGGQNELSFKLGR